MPSYQVVTPATPEQEPVSLAQACVHCAIDLDLASIDQLEVARKEHLQTLVTGAREYAESYTGRLYAGQTVDATFRMDEAYALPAGGQAISVTGYFTDLAQLGNQSTYLEEYRKGISISREYPMAWLLEQTYTVRIAVTTPVVKAQVKAAILELVAEWNKNRESSVNGTISVQTQMNWERKLASERINPLGS